MAYRISCSGLQYCVGGNRIHIWSDWLCGWLVVCGGNNDRSTSRHGWLMIVSAWLLGGDRSYFIRMVKVFHTIARSAVQIISKSKATTCLVSRSAIVDTMCGSKSRPECKFCHCLCGCAGVVVVVVSWGQWIKILNSIKYALIATLTSILHRWLVWSGSEVWERGSRHLNDI